MPYLGNTPTEVPLSSADLLDGIITTAKIANGAVIGADINSTFDLTGKTVTLPAGTGGKVLQYVTSANTANEATTSTSYVDATNLSVSITPSSTSNKILILFTGSFQNSASTLNSYLTILRGSTNLATANDYFILNSAGSRIIAGSSAHHIDSPSTTSATTYKIQFKCEASSSATIFANARITVLEIAG